MPRKLFDGLGNVVVAYTQDEVDVLVLNTRVLEATINVLKNHIKVLENSKDRKRRKGATDPLSPVGSDE